MRRENWMRNVFQSYSSIDRVLHALDRQVVSIGVKSHSAFGFADTLQMVDKIMELTDKKKRLCALKLLMEDGTKAIKEDLGKVLVLRFFERLSEQEIANLVGLSLRTVHRKILIGLKECNFYFKSQGFSEEKLRKTFSNEPFVFGNSKKCLKKQLHESNQCVSAYSFV